MDEQFLLNSLFAYKEESMWLKGVNTLAITKDKRVCYSQGNEIWDKEKELTDEEYEEVLSIVSEYKEQLKDLPEELDDGEYIIMDGSSYEIYAYGRKYITDLAAINYEHEESKTITDEDKEIDKHRKAQKLLNEMLTRIEHEIGFKFERENKED